jgi:hypothetical protein
MANREDDMTKEHSESREDQKYDDLDMSIERKSAGHIYLGACE